MVQSLINAWHCQQLLQLSPGWCDSGWGLDKLCWDWCCKKHLQLCDCWGLKNSLTAPFLRCGEILELFYNSFELSMRKLLITITLAKALNAWVWCAFGNVDFFWHLFTVPSAHSTKRHKTVAFWVDMKMICDQTQRPLLECWSNIAENWKSQMGGLGFEWGCSRG